MALMGWGKKSPPKHLHSMVPLPRRMKHKNLYFKRGNCCLWGYLLLQEFMFPRGNGHVFPQVFQGQFCSWQCWRLLNARMERSIQAASAVKNGLIFHSLSISYTVCNCGFIIWRHFSCQESSDSAVLSGSQPWKVYSCYAVMVILRGCLWSVPYRMRNPYYN